MSSATAKGGTRQIRTLLGESWGSQGGYRRYHSRSVIRPAHEGISLQLERGDIVRMSGQKCDTLCLDDASELKHSSSSKVTLA